MIPTSLPPQVPPNPSSSFQPPPLSRPLSALAGSQHVASHTPLGGLNQTCLSPSSLSKIALTPQINQVHPPIKCPLSPSTGVLCSRTNPLFTRPTFHLSSPSSGHTGLLFCSLTLSPFRGHPLFLFDCSQAGSCAPNLPFLIQHWSAPGLWVPSLSFLPSRMPPT